MKRQMTLAVLLLAGMSAIAAQGREALEQRRITVHAKDVQLAEVVAMIAKEAEISVFVHPDVAAEKVTLNATAVPVMTLLSGLALTYDLELEPVSGGELYVLRKAGSKSDSDSRVVRVDGPATGPTGTLPPPTSQPRVVIPGSTTPAASTVDPRVAAAQASGANTSGLRSPVTASTRQIDVRRPHDLPQRSARGLRNDPQKIQVRYVEASLIAGLYGGPAIITNEYTGKHEWVRPRVNVPSTPVVNLGDTVNRHDGFIDQAARRGRRTTTPQYRPVGNVRDQFGDEAGGGLFGGDGGGTTGGDSALPLPPGVDLVIGYDLISALIVYGDEEGVEQLRRLVELIDVAPQQIEVEARFVNLSVSDADALGMVWTLTDGTNTVTGSTPSAGGASIAFQTATGNFQALITAITRNNRGKVVNAPKVATQNGQPAIVMFSQVIPVTLSDTVITDASQTVSTSIETLEVTTALLVVPRVTGEPPNETITTVIQPQVSDVIGFVDNPSGGTIPIQAIQNISTILRVRDGETIAMGGLVRKNNSTNSTKIPILGDLPFIGDLFRSRTKNVDESELLVFLTPRILRERLTAGPSALR